LKSATPSYSRVFVLCANNNPILAFSAGNHREAQELCKEPWLQEDLRVLASNGEPLIGPGSKLTVRPASTQEAAVYQQGFAAARTDDLALVYLVGIDGGSDTGSE
jgi:hypothetical protein